MLLANFAFFFFPHCAFVPPPMDILNCLYLHVLYPSLPQLCGLVCFSSLSQHSSSFCRFSCLVSSPSSSWVYLVFINRVYLLFPLSCDFPFCPCFSSSSRPTTRPHSYDVVPVLGTPLFPPPPPWSISRPQQLAPGPWSGSKASSSPLPTSPLQAPTTPQPPPRVWANCTLGLGVGATGGARGGCVVARLGQGRPATGRVEGLDRVLTLEAGTTWWDRSGTEAWMSNHSCEYKLPVYTDLLNVVLKPDAHCANIYIFLLFFFLFFFLFYDCCLSDCTNMMIMSAISPCSPIPVAHWS